MAVIGLDLGATKVAGALFGADGEIATRALALLEHRDGDEVGQLIVEQVSTLRDEASARGWDVKAVAAAVPGLAHPETGIVWAPNIGGWEDYPLRDVLLGAVGDSCPVVVESDRAASILGEVARGAARGCRHAVFLAVGTGIGAGILVDGAIVRGAHDTAGAIGWMGLDRPYRPGYVRCGGFESHASGAGIARTTQELLRGEPGYGGPLRETPPETITAHQVFAAFAAGDRLAAKVIANAVECWGMAVANLVSLFDPEIVVLGGGLFGPAAAQLDRIVAEARQWAQPMSFPKVKVCVSALGPEACLFGTGELARRAAFAVEGSAA
jgi:glucokinase